MKTEIKEKTQIEKINDSCDNYIASYESKNIKFIKLGNWLEKESSIFSNESKNIIYNKPNFKRGEIIKLDFGINIGSELSNTHYAIVLNSDDNNSVDNITVLPLTSKSGYKRLPLGKVLKSFGKSYSLNTYALITQITTISKKKIFEDKIKCRCDEKTILKINEALIDYLTK